jgi:hypothetical protein
MHQRSSKNSGFRQNFDLDKRRSKRPKECLRFLPKTRNPEQHVAGRHGLSNWLEKYKPGFIFLRFAGLFADAHQGTQASGRAHKLLQENYFCAINANENLQK